MPSSSLLSGLKATRIGECSYQISRQKQTLTLHILENDLMRFQQTPYPACALLCYDISDWQSLLTLKQYWLKQLGLCKPVDTDSMPMMLVGLKRDLLGSDPTNYIDTQAALKEGQAMRISHFGECSAKNGQFMKPVAEDFLAMLKACVETQANDSYSYCVMS